MLGYSLVNAELAHKVKSDQGSMPQNFPQELYLFNIGLRDIMMDHPLKKP
jgi:hypothetical protein